MRKEQHVHFECNPKLNEVPLRYVAWFAIAVTIGIVWLVVVVPIHDKNMMQTYGPKSPAQAAKTK